MSVEAPDVRPDLHQRITLLDNVLRKTEAGAVLPERVRIHLKEERALLVNLLESLGRETGTEPQPR
jgi:ribosome-binding protein aMBF1 (putative translation factor)